MIEYNKKNKSLKGIKANSTSKESFLKIRCDVVVLAALELQVCGKEAGYLNCKVILEGANGPIDLEADDILHNKKIDVIPDILANSEGAVVSYYEWLQNKRKEYWSLEKVRDKLDIRMRNTYSDVYKFSKKNKLSMRTAAYVLALKNLEYNHHIKYDI